MADIGDRLRDAVNVAEHEITLPPFGHAFTVPMDKMDAKFLSWIRQNCLIVTEAEYTSLRRDLEIEIEVNGVLRKRLFAAKALLREVAIWFDDPSSEDPDVFDRIDAFIVADPPDPSWREFVSRDDYDVLEARLSRADALLRKAMDTVDSCHDCIRIEAPALYARINAHLGREEA